MIKNNNAERGSTQSDESAVVIDTHTAKRKLRGKKRPLFVIACFIVVAAIAVGGYFLLGRQKTGDDKKNKPLISANTVRETTGGTHEVQDRAEDLWLAGKNAEAQKLLDDAIAKSTDKVAKGSLYEMKAKLAVDSKTALEYAEKAESIQPTAGSARLAAQHAETLGNKVLASSYYEKLLNRLSPEQRELAGPGIRQKIATLRGTPQ
ncbi:hypothetical protein IPL85_02775 [Candidatus Saccharibacteria bacterium]|nr:MAG: hypothetical protein IPL85_02775 [Candidatus Saccharibacteria bacterium]